MSVPGGVYLKTWCPDYTPDCAVCCRWAPSTSDSANLSFNGDGSINQAASLCGHPYWGLGCRAVTAGAPGDIVDGYVDLTLTGEYFRNVALPPPTLLTQVWDPGTVASVTFLGSFDPLSGTPSSFSQTPAIPWRDPGSGSNHGTWTCNSALTVHGCVMLGGPGDQIASPCDCVYVSTNTIPNPEYVIAPVWHDGTYFLSVGGWAGGPLPQNVTFLTAPPIFYVRSQYSA
jgi:hypothetical protein